VAAPATDELILSDERETVLRIIVLPQLLSLYDAGRRDRSLKCFSGLDREPFAAALNGWFFNDHAVKLTADGIRGVINELINIVRIVGLHPKYGGTLMARKNYIDTDDREDTRNEDFHI